jgi:potassium efflux system protein
VLARLVTVKIKNTPKTSTKLALGLRLAVVPFVLLMAASAIFAQNPLRAVPVSQTQSPPKSQDNPATASSDKPDEISIDKIKISLQSLEAATDVAEEIKAKAIEKYNQAISQLERAETLLQNSEQYRAAIENLDERASQFRDSLKSLSEAKPKPIPSGSLTELEQKLSQQSLDLETQRAEQAKADSETSRRAARRKEIPNRQVKLQEELAEVEKELIGSTLGDEPAVMKSARKAEMQARKKMLLNELPALTNELAMYQAEELVGLPQLNSDLVSERVKLAEQELQRTRDAVQKSRVEAANEQLAAAQQQLESVPKELESIALRNYLLAEENKDINMAIEAKANLLRVEKAKLQQLQLDYTKTTKMVETVGLTAAVGKMLRKERIGLPELQSYRKQVNENQPEIDKVLISIFELQSERSADDKKSIREIVGDQFSDEQQQKIEKLAAKLMAEKKNFLDPLLRSKNSYFDELVELSTTQQQIIKLTETYAEFIDERVLWIRSNDSLTAGFHLKTSELWFLDLSKWRQLWQVLLVDIRINWPLYLSTSMALGVWLFFGVRFRKRISDIGRQVKRGSFTQFLPTVRTLLLTLLVAFPVPAFFWFIGWRTLAISHQAEAAEILSNGFFSVAYGLFVLKFLRQTCRDSGLAESHFGWQSESVAHFRKNLGILIVVGLPLVFLVATLDQIESGLSKNLLSRIAFILLTIIIAFFNYRILHPRRGVLRQYLAAHGEGWIDRLRHVWFWPVVVAPLAFALLAFFGYYYTAQQLSIRLFITSCLVCASVILFAFFQRLLLVYRRRLSIEQARQRRAAEAEQRDETGAPAVAPELAEPDALEELRAQTAQSQILVKTLIIGATLVASWFVWVDVLPALGFLDQWPVWENVVEVRETVIGATGTAETRTHDEIHGVTVIHLGLAIFIGIVTIIAARNFPGTLEIGVLRRLPLEHSVRYAITSLVSYAIMMTGVFIACSTIGLRWNQIQWMATALTFGLAFGLQEMFANFVAGIIILFERPVRVGDLVTVDDITGVVKRVRIRATTITSLDRKDYVVPNKEFITGRLLNWTLSDQVLRLSAFVGIAYGSDTRLAYALLQKVAQQNSSVLAEPAPSVIFKEFGDNSLNFELRVFIGIAERRFEVIHDLNMAIDQEFRKAKIEIAFPQRDLHLRSLPDDITQWISDGQKLREQNDRPDASKIIDSPTDSGNRST